MTYTLLGTVFTLGALAAIAYVTWAQIQDVRTSVAREDAVMAQQELEAALERVSMVSTEFLAELNGWDELRQQLNDRRYYGYWVANRARSASGAPGFVRGIHLYGLDHEELGPEGGPPMPAMNPERAAGVPVKPDGYEHFLAVAPVTTLGPQGLETLGYVLVEIDLAEAVRELGVFRRLMASTLALEPLPAAESSLGDAGSWFSYEVAENSGVTRMGELTVRMFGQWAGLLLLGALVLFAVVATMLVQPMRRLAAHIDELREKGGGLLLSSLRAPLPITELEKVRQSLNSYELALQDVHSHLDEKNRQLWQLAHSDALTNASNRRALEDDWAALAEQARVGRISLALLLFDCDHFKAINDTYGHQTGDKIIQGMAQALQSALRRGDKLYRLGGDEFASLVITDTPETAMRVGQRCIEAVAEYDFRALGLAEPVRISIGVSFTDNVAAVRLEDLHREADSAMYLAKRPGHDHIALFDPALSRDAEALLSTRVITTVYEALEDPQRISMFYQPILDLETAAISHYEALVRIRRDDELLMPSLVFPVVESHRLERELDVAVLRAVLSDLEAGHIPEGTGVAVNFAGPSLQSPEVVEALDGLHRFLNRYRIVLEVTETLLITHMQGVAAALERLREQGFLIALDDFGSGYSSLMYLAQMPVDVVKFDIAMTRALQRKDTQAAVIADLVQMIRRAGYRIVAEGVEDDAQLRTASRLGFDYVQGYLLGRPSRDCVSSDALGGTVIPRTVISRR
jgi:diguanylate cyclase (GGDEF)-like protein